jgi:peptide/nickel transport system substrate-binding protein
MTNTKISRRALLASAGAVGALGLARSADAQRGEAVLRIVAPWEYTSNDPTDIGYILTRIGVAQTLVEVEPDGKLVGGVAARWSVDVDGKTWRFAIRPGMQFHDGTAVTATTVADSLKKAFGGESLSAVPLDSIAAEDDAVVIRTTTVFSVLPAFLVDYAAIVLGPASYAADGSVQRIVATGPYRIAAVDGKNAIELERFEGYGRAKPAIARVRYLAVSNGDTRANIAVAGDADLIYTLAPTAVARINAAGQTRVESLTIPRVRPLAFNSGLPQFEDVRVRRALSMAIDRIGIANAILRHPGSVPNQLLPPILTDWHNKALQTLTYDVAGARRLLDEAGWIPGSDGVRVKGGHRLAAKLLTIANRPELPPIAAALQAQFREVGVAVAIEVGTAAGIPAAIREGKMEMTLSARTYVNVPEPVATIIPDFTRERSTWGTVNWPGRTRIKILTDEYVTIFDESRQAHLRAEITRIIHEEAPVVPVAWFEHTVAVSPRLKNVQIDPYEMRYLAERAAWV